MFEPHCSITVHIGKQEARHDGIETCVMATMNGNSHNIIGIVLKLIIPDNFPSDNVNSALSHFFLTVSTSLSFRPSGVVIQDQVANEPPSYLNAISNVRFRIGLFETDIKFGGGSLTGDATVDYNSPFHSRFQHFS